MDALTNPFINLGMAGATLFIIYIMIRYFMSSLDKKDQLLETKDEAIRGLIKDFQNHIELCNTNFMKSSELVAQNAKKQADAITALIKRVRVLEK